jgi:hypothetical protein
MLVPRLLIKNILAFRASAEKCPATKGSVDIDVAQEAKAGYCPVPAGLISNVLAAFIPIFPLLSMCNTVAVALSVIPRDVKAASATVNPVSVGFPENTKLPGDPVSSVTTAATSALVPGTMDDHSICPVAVSLRHSR